MGVVTENQYLRRSRQIQSASAHIAGAYIPSVDGLRALAVLLVMFCHAKWSLFSGGYIGVDLFFVISGFVVTQSIRRDQAASGFSLPQFYARRMKRLAPSLYMVMAATLVFGVLFCFPTTNFDIVRVAGFVSVLWANVFFSKETGYFVPSADAQPLLHTWSLSVEEQFYLVLPVLLVLLRKANAATRICVLALLGFVSFWSSQHATSIGNPAAYFFFSTRAFEFVLGVLAALTLEKLPATTSGRHREALMAAGIGLILWLSVAFDAETPMPGVNAFLACLGAVLVIAGKDAQYVGRVLSNRVMIYLGQLSYVAYLWHWPVLFALRRFHLSGAAWAGTGLAGALLLSIPTHHWIESPLRRLTWGVKKTVGVLFVLPIVVLGALVAIGKKTDNFAPLYPAAVEASYKAAGRFLFNDDRAGRCFGKTEMTSAGTCTLGAPGSKTKAVFLGDSHAYQLINFMDQLGKDYGISIHDFTQPKCPPILSSPSKAGNPASQPFLDRCALHNRAAFAKVFSDQTTQIVFIGAYWSMYANEATSDHVSPSGLGYMPGQLDVAMRATVQKLVSAGKQVIMFDDVPTLPLDIANCPLDRLYLPGKSKAACTYSEALAAGLHRSASTLLAGLRREFPSIAVIHTYDVPCDRGLCRTEAYGVPLYKDGDPHLGVGGSAIYYRAYRDKHPDELRQILHGGDAR